jgi:hypothetical protein
MVKARIKFGLNCPAIYFAFTINRHSSTDYVLLEQGKTNLKTHRSVRPRTWCCTCAAASSSST